MLWVGDEFGSLWCIVVVIRGVLVDGFVRKLGADLLVLILDIGRRIQFSERNC